MDDTEAKSPANDEAATSTVLQHDDLTGTGANKETTDDSRPTKQRVTVLQMVCAGFWTMGINYAFNAEFVLGTPLFSSLGMTPFWTSFAWLAGPLSGLFFQPPICALSDKTTFRWGRRKPYLLLGCVVGMIGMILFANPQELATAVGGNDDVAIVFAITSLWIYNIGLNIAQGPAWALMLDLCPDEQQNLGQAIFTFMSSLAGVASYFLGFLNLAELMPIFKDNQHALFYIGVLTLAITTAVTLIFAKDKPYVKDLNDLGEAESDSIWDRRNWFFDAIRPFIRITRPVAVIFVTYFFIQAAFSPFQFYFTNYMGETVYGGNAEGASGTSSLNDFNTGVRMGSLAFASWSIVTMIYALLIPLGDKLVGVKVQYVFGFLSTAIFFALPLIPQLQTNVASQIIFPLAGVGQAIGQVTPFSLIGQSVAEKDVGLFVGGMNAVQVIAQMVANFVSSLAMTIATNLAWGMATGALFALIGAPFVWFLRIPSKKANTVEVLIEEDPIDVMQAESKPSDETEEGAPPLLSDGDIKRYSD